jgi:hypothetical protein
MPYKKGYSFILKNMKKLKILLARWKILMGVCPECNSDAPEVYDCYICGGDRSFYPSKMTREKRLDRYKKSLNCKHY